MGNKGEKLSETPLNLQTSDGKFKVQFTDADNLEWELKFATHENMQNAVKYLTNVPQTTINLLRYPLREVL